MTNLEKLLATLPPVRIDECSITVLATESQWFYDRVGQNATKDWIISYITPYECEGYKFSRIHFESVDSATGGPSPEETETHTVDIGFEESPGGDRVHLWMRPQDVREYVESLRAKLKEPENDSPSQ